MKHHNLFAWTNFSFFSLLILRKVFLSFVLTKIALDKVLFINVVRRNVTKSNTFSRFLNCTNGTKFATHLNTIFSKLFFKILLQKETKMLQVLSHLFLNFCEKIFCEGSLKLLLQNCFNCDTLLL